MGYIQKLITNDEQILVQRRQHWSAIVSSLLKFTRNVLGAGLFAGAFQAVSSNGVVSSAFSGVPGIGVVRAAAQPAVSVVPEWLIGAVALLAVGGATFVLGSQLVGWFSNRNIVTNRRVIQLTGALSKRALDSSLEKINDVDLRQSWLGRILGYGSVAIMTSNGAAVNKITHIGDPVGFKRTLLTAKQDTATQMTAAQIASAQAVPAIADRIGSINELYKQGLISTEEYVAKRKSLLDAI